MRKTTFVALIATLFALAASSGALADGTETLGPPQGVTLASGTGVLVAGSGMQAKPDLPGSFSFSVPGAVKQVLLYWEGHFSSPFASTGDNSIMINGVPVTGALIGGPTAFFGQASDPTPQTEMFSTYRANITGLNLVAPGANTLTISEMLFQSNFPNGGAFNQGNDGAGVLVVYDAGGTAATIDVRDGSDLAFANFAPPLDTTVAQTFTFAASADARTATLATLAGSVSGPDLGGLRGNVLRGTFDTGQSFELVNGWQSADGAEFDALNSSVTVPAGASSLTVQALSAGGDRPASFAWIGAALSVPNDPPPPPPPPSGETATGAGFNWSWTYGAPENWFMYTPWVQTTVNKVTKPGISPGGVDLIAGQHFVAGRITGTRGSAANSTSITITLNSSWGFDGATGNVKINPMTCTNKQNYVQPGGFAVHRTAAASDNAITVTGLANTACYGIHADVVEK